jgi:hypothetical protein
LASEGPFQAKRELKAYRAHWAPLDKSTRWLFSSLSERADVAPLEGSAETGAFNARSVATPPRSERDEVV